MVHRSTVVATLLAALTFVQGCGKDEAPATSGLTELQQLPPISVEPVEWSVSRRARILVQDADKAASARDCAKAGTLAVEATTLDPSLASARLQAARVYASCGVPTTAIALLAQLADKAANCGECVEALQAARADKTLAGLWKTQQGGKLKARIDELPALTKTVRTWALRLAKDIVAGKADGFAELVHPREPWHLVRSCPECADKARRAPEDREFFGFVVARKLAMRFQPGGKAYGAVPLRAHGEPTCAGRCCRWSLPKPVPVGAAALRTVCLRPITLAQGALTKLEIVYGKPVADVRPAGPAAAERKTVVLPPPSK